jgi:hypothetical protein
VRSRSVALTPTPGMLPGPAKVGAHAPGVQPRKRGAKPPSIGYPGRRSRERPSKTTGNADNQPNRLSVRASHPIEMNRHPESRCNRCSGGAFDQLAALPDGKPTLEAKRRMPLVGRTEPDAAETASGSLIGPGSLIPAIREPPPIRVLAHWARGTCRALAASATPTNISHAIL